MKTVGDIVRLVGDRTTPDSTPEWDPVGLQLGDLELAVESIAVCHEVTEAVVAALEENPVDLLVSYHPLLFEKTNRVRAGSSPEGRSFRLIRAGVSLLVTHTDFDAAVGGTADSLATHLGLDDVQPFGADVDSGLPDIGRVGVFGSTLGQLADVVAESFGATGLRVTGHRSQMLDRVAVVPGSGRSLIDDAAGLADALVTGDVPHHDTVRALDLGLAIVDPGHTATERPGMRALFSLLESDAGLPIVDLTGYDPRTWS